MKPLNESNRGDSPFSGIIIACLVVIAIAICGGVIIGGTSASYNATVVDNSSYVNIASKASDIVGVTNQTSSNFFGNKTSTTQQTAVDRMVGTAYSSIVILGSVPDVFTTVIDSVGGVLGLDSSLTSLLLAGVIAIIVGIAIWLAVGRR